MKELIQKIKHVKLENVNGGIFLDTCFFIDLMKHPDKMKDLEKHKNIYISSFNMEELMHVEPRMKKMIKVNLRRMLHHPSFAIVDVNVNPYNKDSEIDFVNSVDEDLLEKVRCAPDAVLIAIAIKAKADVVTKDKHHLFNVKLENFIKKYDIKVYKKLN